MTEHYHDGWGEWVREVPCLTCDGDPAVCASVPGLRHCEKANRDGPLPAHVPLCTLVEPTSPHDPRYWKS